VTNLPVTHGDSGSGLFDSRGRLIGLNTWVQVERDGSHGISLPAEAMRILADAIARGSLGDLDKLQSGAKE
jgi:S1-C subfamily serine protease